MNCFVIKLDTMRAFLKQVFQPSVSLFGVLLFSCLSVSVFSQDLGSVGKKEAVKVSGNIGLNTGFYAANGRESRRDPFLYLLNANINFNIYGVNIPFSAIYSQQETNFLQPFNQFGLSPYYKNLKIHLGYRAMNFSSFTLNGHTFLGAGFEFNPMLTENIQLRTGGMYGRLRRAVEPRDSLFNRNLSYKRMGYSAKVGVGNGAGSFVDFILFKAKDDVNSIDINQEAFSKISPAENLVFGVVAEHTIAQKLLLKFDYSSSAYTRDTRSGEDPEISNGTLFNNLGTLFTPKASSQFRSAIKGGIQYELDAFSVGLNYQRIDTDFRTLGAYFFLNDIEDYTANFSAKVYQDKVRLTSSVGWQRNNLSQDKSARTTRFIAALGLTYNSGNRWNFGLNASNYSSFLTVVQDQFSDSSNVFQVSQNLSFNTDYLLVQEGDQQSIWANIGLQKGAFRDEYQIDNMESQFVTFSTGHRIRWRKDNLNLNTSFTFTSNTAPGFESLFFGPNVNVSKRLGKSGTRISLGTTYVFGFQDGTYTYDLMTNRISLSTRFKKRHRLSLGTVLFFKQDKVNSSFSYSEIKGNLGYRYSF